MKRSAHTNSIYYQFRGKDDIVTCLRNKTRRISILYVLLNHCPYSSILIPVKLDYAGNLPSSFLMNHMCSIMVTWIIVWPVCGWIEDIFWDEFISDVVEGGEKKNSPGCSQRKEAIERNIIMMKFDLSIAWITYF